MKIDRKTLRIRVTFGMRGYFAVMYDKNGPIQTSDFTCRTYKAAVKDARAWAEAEQIPCNE
jgi:hypothetical protein